MTRASLIALAAAVLLGLPASASATPNCAWNLATHVLSVGYSASGGTATLAVDDSGVVELNGAVCGQTANVNTIDSVVVKDTSGKSVTLQLDLAHGGFAPGAAAEPASPEIEFDVDLGSGTNDTVEFEAAPAGSAVTVGQQGVNLDPVADKAGGPAGSDVDMTLAGVEQTGFRGDAGNDAFKASGGDATGSASDVYAYGSGGGGNDVMRGGNADDRLDGNAGDDTVDGGNGADYTYYVQAAGPVTVDLGTAAPQDTGGDGTDTLLSVEDIRGSDYGDTIRGTDGVNVIEGEAGDDTIYGDGGNDVLMGDAGHDAFHTGAGHDSVYAQDGVVDTIACDTGTDDLLADADDVLVGCGSTTPADPDPAPTTTPDPAATATPPAGDPTPKADQGDSPLDPSAHPSEIVPTPTATATPAGTERASSPLAITARRQSRRAIRRHGLRVRLTAAQDLSVAVHAGHAQDVFWHVEAGRALTVRLRISRRAARAGRVTVLAVAQDAHGAERSVRTTVRFR